MANDAELIVFVNQDGIPTGETAPKLEAHSDKTKLHLAFSCYVFNAKNELLVTKRASNKKVWPGVWTNSVCGHPQPNETLKSALKRRLNYELGITVIKNLEVILPKYRYKTPPFKGIIENEFCPVYFARTSQEPKLNIKEVEDYKWMKLKDFVEQTQADKKNIWSYWCKDQIKQLKGKTSLI